MLHILNGRREQPFITREETAAEGTAVAENDWFLANLWVRLKEVKTWLPPAARGMVFDRSAYQEIVDGWPMTGPALFLGIIIMIVSGLLRTERELVVVLLWPA